MQTFLYLNLGRGRATVAINEHPENKTAEIGVAFCSPNDQFVKELGRNIAEKRLQEKKDFYICFERNNEKLKWQARDLVKFVILGRWASKLDFETELEIKVHEIVTDTISDFPNDIAPMTVHTNTVPTWAKRAVAEKNFY